MTKRESILRAVLDILKDLASVEAANVERSRVAPMAEKKLAAVSLEPGPDVENEVSLGKFDHTFIISVIISCQGDVPDSLADPIVEEVRNKLLLDRTLGGLLMDLTPMGTDPQFDLGNKPIVDIKYNFKLQYRDN